MSLIAVMPSNAFAHKVNVFAYAEDGKVHAECYFVDGAHCANSGVTVEDSAGKVVAKGTTDSEGRYVFDIPKADALKIVLHAGMGHANEYTLSKDEVTAAMKRPGAGGRGPEGKAGEQKKKDSPPVSAMQQAVEHTGCVGSEELRAVVDEAVESRLKPMYTMLSEMRQAQDRPKLTDAIGGIGYIMGIMGVIMYFKSRKVQ